jgi:broad specificity phosphatase PhoE
MGELVLVRHGETEWSRAGRHTGRTDLALTARGEDQARSLKLSLLQPTDPDRPPGGFAFILASPARRATHTAELAGLAGFETDDRLWEWDYGEYEGRTTPEIQAERPGWYLWRDGVPGGETVERVGARADAVLERVRPHLARGDVALVAHGHMLRILTARWLGLPPADGRLFRLDNGTTSVLGAEHGRPVIAFWNVSGHVR